MKSDETPDQALAAMVEDVFAFGKKLTGRAISREIVPTRAEIIPPHSHQISEQVLSESAEPPVTARANSAERIKNRRRACLDD